MVHIHIKNYSILIYLLILHRNATFSTNTQPTTTQPITTQPTTTQPITTQPTTIHLTTVTSKKTRYQFLDLVNNNITNYHSFNIFYIFIRKRRQSITVIE